MKDSLPGKLHTIGIISPGHMGHSIGLTLCESGFEVVTCLSERSNRTKKLSSKVGIRDLGTVKALVQNSDVLLSIVPPKNALEVASTVASQITVTDTHLLFVDCNANLLGDLANL